MVEDRDMEEILESAEPGVTGLLTDYEDIERRYFAAAASTVPATPPIVYGTTTPVGYQPG